MLPLVMQVKNLHYWCTQAWILNCSIALRKPCITSSRSHPHPIHDVHVTDRASLGVVCVCVWALRAFYCRNRAHESVCGQCSSLSSVHSMQLSMCYCCTCTGVLFCGLNVIMAAQPRGSVDVMCASYMHMYIM